ncbi:MAG: hypothetical protein ACI4V1_10970 [Eubacteriales bacterium]
MDPNRKNQPRMYRNQVFTDEMPLGLGMALAQNPSALDRFAQLNEEEKHELIGSVHGIRSKEEMRAFVEHFAGLGDAKKIF